MTQPAGAARRGRASTAATSAAVELSPTEAPLFANFLDEAANRVQGQAEQDNRASLDKFFVDYLRGMANRIRDQFLDGSS